jgi:hypothetical protein
MKTTEELEKMCDFTDLVKDETLLAVYSNMKNTAYDINTICSMLGISMWKLCQLRKLLSEEIALKPKIV